MRRRLLWILLAFVLLALLIYALPREGETFAGLGVDDMSALIWQVALVVVVGSLVLTMFRERMMKALEAALIWVLIGLVLVVGYTYRLELREVGERILAELVPGRTATRGRTVEVARGRTGSFSINTRVNDATIPMILDTGASSVVLTHEAAAAAGLPIDLLSYTVTVDTANGRTRAAPVTLDRIAVGGISERSVPALIAQRGQLRTSLLGMTFLDRLERWEVRGDRLVLRGKS